MVTFVLLVGSLIVHEPTLCGASACLGAARPGTPRDTKRGRMHVHPAPSS
ncbi:hypothetical protein ACFPRL_08100 [Pseudoclavibacter helvolus]